MSNDILAWAQAVLETTPQRWLTLAEMVPTSLLSRPAAPNEWSALECLQHLVDAEKVVFPVRVGLILTGQDFPAYDPDQQGTKPDTNTDPLQLAQDFARTRQESLAVFKKITSADLGRLARHEELGTITLGELLHEWAGHDLMHTVQAEQAMLQPFIAGCGPWKPYFAAHWQGE